MQSMTGDSLGDLSTSMQNVDTTCVVDLCGVELARNSNVSYTVRIGIEISLKVPQWDNFKGLGIECGTGDSPCRTWVNFGCINKHTSRNCR